MIRWLRENCFTNLELEAQKNRLLFFLLCGPIFVMAELNVSAHYSLFGQINGQFLLVICVFLGVMLLLLFAPVMEKNYKYIFMTGMLIFSMYQLWTFNEHSLIYQIMYINLALALIYLDGYLIMYTGMATAVITAVGFIFWKDLFFPYMDDATVNGSIIIMLQTTVVLWGVTKIGNRFHYFVNHNQQMQKLLQENETQILLIHEQNQALTQYSKQVEQLTIVEERNRISQELHDTIGHTLTSMIAGLELTKQQLTYSNQGQEEPNQRLDTLLLTARKGLEDIRDHVHKVERYRNEESLNAQISQLANELYLNTGTIIEFAALGEECELSQQQHLALLRCAQEALTNAMRYAQADKIYISLRYELDKIQLEIKDNGVGADKDRLKQGFGLKAMRERIEAVHGTIQMSSGFGYGVHVTCQIPIKRRSDTKDIRLLLVEDQELIAESFSILLGMEPDLQVVGVAGNGKSAVDLCEHETPDVILMDIHMPIMDGIEATKIIKYRWPDVKVIILTTFQDIHNAAEAISLGAEGYLMKSVQPKHLAEAIRIIHSGGTLISMETAKLLVDTQKEDPSQIRLGNPIELTNEDSLYSLTDKELEIMQCLSDGMKYKDVAQKLHYSEGTIKNYVSIIYSKLNVENRMQAVKKIQNKLTL